MSDVPGGPLPAHIQDLERDLREHPEDLDCYSALLSVFLTPELYAHPRRIELILDIVSRARPSQAVRWRIRIRKHPRASMPSRRRVRSGGNNPTC